MPSFLSKVLGRKKEDKTSSSSSSSPTSDPSLLGGKFEQISPTVSPSAGKFSDAQASDGRKDKEKMKEGPFSLLRIKSKDATSKEQNADSEAPQLSLFLEPQADQTLANALEAELRTMTDADIARSRLTPKQALSLVHACSKAIADRGLETLGIMHPHWHSASPDVQRRLISLFLHSLVAKDPSTTVITASASSTFQSELGETRSPHDVAAVLRWAVRHLELEHASFGEQEDWYKIYLDSERNSGYPVRSYSQTLPPLVRTAHLDLLTTLLDTVSSLAAHAESNGISGSRLSKLLGLWLLCAQRAQKDDDWTAFYNRWDKYGRILEHLFLSYIRDEADKHQMPRRLTELVQSYPYNKSQTTSDDGLLSRPRFSTRRHHALHIQVTTELPTKSPRPPRHPLVLIADAFKAAAPDSESDSAHADVWDNIRSAVARDGGSLQQVFSDETIRYLSMLPRQPGFDASQLGFFFDRAEQTGEDSASTPSQSLNGHGLRQSVDFARPDPIPDTLAIDWTSFSTSGFLDSSPPAPLAQTLLDRDVDTLTPRVSRSGSKRAKQRFADTSSFLSSAQMSNKQTEAVLASYTPKVMPLGVVPVDEAFVDFCSDAMFDPIASDWPSFALCKLRSNLPGLDVEGKNVEYLVLERTIVAPPPPVLAPIQTTQIAADSSRSPTTPRATSPRPSLKAFSPSLKKRFSVWAKKNSGQAESKVDEQGAIVAEEEAPAAPAKASLNILKEEEDSSTAVVAGAVAATTAVGLAAAAVVSTSNESSETPAASDAPEIKNAEEEQPTAVATEGQTSAKVDDEMSLNTPGQASQPIDSAEVALDASEPLSEQPIAPTETNMPTPAPIGEVKAVLVDVPAEDSQPPSDDAPISETAQVILPSSQVDSSVQPVSDQVLAEEVAGIEPVPANVESSVEDAQVTLPEVPAAAHPLEVTESEPEKPVSVQTEPIHVHQPDDNDVTIVRPQETEAEVVPDVEDLVSVEVDQTAEPEVEIVQTGNAVSTLEDAPVVSNVHVEPIREPTPTPQDDTVSISPVPVVDVEPAVNLAASSSAVEAGISVPADTETIAGGPPGLDAIAEPEATAAAEYSTAVQAVDPEVSQHVEDVPSAEVDAVVESGLTPSPQVLLDSVIEPVEAPAAGTTSDSLPSLETERSRPVQSEVAVGQNVAEPKEVSLAPQEAEHSDIQTASTLANAASEESAAKDSELVPPVEVNVAQPSDVSSASEQKGVAEKDTETVPTVESVSEVAEDTQSPDTKPIEDAHEVKP